MLRESLDEESEALGLLQEIVLPRLLQDSLRMIVRFENIRDILKEILESDAFRLLIEEEDKQMLKHRVTEAAHDAVESDFVGAAFLKTAEIVEKA